jgi:hypothetical protein
MTQPTLMVSGNDTPIQDIVDLIAENVSECIDSKCVYRNGSYDILLKSDLRTEESRELLRDVRKLPKQRSLGRGAVGTVMSLNKTVDNIPLVVKIISPPERDFFNIQSSLDDDVQGVLLGYQGDVPTVSLPTYLSEAVIGNEMYKLVQQGYTLAYPYFDSFALDRNTAYISLEELNTKLPINNITEVGLYFFQLFHAIHVGQRQRLLTHYDSHIGNVAAAPTTPTSVAFPLYNRANEYLQVENIPFVLKIIDFGLARAIVTDSIGQAMLINHDHDDIITESFGTYSPLYDGLANIGSFLYENLVYVSQAGYSGTYHGVRDTLALQGSDDFFRDIIDIVRSGQVTQDDIEDVISTYFRQVKGPSFYQSSNISPFWRPKTNPTIKDYATSFMEIAQNMADALVVDNKDFTITTNPTADIVLQPAPWIVGGMQLDTALKTAQSIDIPVTMSGAYANLKTIIPGYAVYTVLHFGNNVPPLPYHITIPKIALLKPQRQVVHIVFANIDEQLQRDYQVWSPCCKTSLIPFMSDKVGFAMNGTFYDRNGTFAPIGAYVDRRIYKPEEVGAHEEYEQDMVGVRFDGQSIRLVPRDTVDDLQNGSGFAFVAGPVLVARNQVAFSRNKLGQKLDGAMKYICHSGRPDTIVNFPVRQYRDAGDRWVASNTGSTLPVRHCGDYPPGNLLHAGNPNPRSAMAKGVFRVSGRDYQYAFIVVEGRAQRGVGMDLVQLAQLIRGLGDIEWAVNLDGGASSNLAYRVAPNQPVYYNNPFMNMNLPVGNLLAITRKV